MALSQTKANINKDERDYLYVAAIDIGSSHSGYAFSPTGDEKDIKINRNWGEEWNQQSYKCPTSVLIGPDGKFVSFGFSAEHDFSVKTENGEASEYNLFRHFKMILNQNKLTSKTEVTSTTGTKKTAIDIFAMALGYLKDHFLKEIKKSRVVTLDIAMIQWVITVPAIWRDDAKWFMREAAVKAGLITEVKSSNLILALEPEAGSLFCRDLQIRLKTSKEDNYFQKGNRYMVVDAGGGTVDITVHEVAGDTKVRELFYATGGPWGAITVDKKFEVLLSEIFGEEMMQKFKDKCPNDWMDIMLRFEKAKMDTSKGAVHIMLSANFREIFEELHPTEEFGHFVKAHSSNQVTAKSGRLTVSDVTLKKLFDYAITETVGQLKEILQQVSGITTILLVGGFGQCDLLKEAIKVQFAAQKVITPTEAQLAIMKGAVLFGHNPSEISMRVARVTYGIGVMSPFDRSKHDEKYKTYDYGKAMCDKLFDLSIRKKQDVETGKVVECDLNANEKSQKKGCATLTLYSTPNDDAMYITEPGVEQLAFINVPLKSRDTRSKLAVHITYGTTELLFKARDKESGEWVETTVDFLKGKG